MHTACILLNGEKPSKDLACDITRGVKVYCCDGAADWAAPYGIAMDFLVGDMDSIHPDNRKKAVSSTTRVIELNPDKDITDGQYALELAIENGEREMILLGALGGRIDHTIANINMMIAAHKAHRGCKIITDSCELFVANTSFLVQGTIGQTISILPIDANVHIRSTTGLFYPCKNTTLQHENTLFISNRFSKEEAGVFFDGGYVLVIIQK
ncbi:thiamine diphosphokinase [Clostridia bacterium OttesenSCG-928-F22]|nr:thiamine diphosphokinase [Clostridia bacterium OttesenSCG-928-F22]